MYLTLWDTERKRLAIGDRCASTKFGHTFGTDIKYSGLTPARGKPNVHVLLRLACRDTRVPIEFPNVNFVPLLCAIRYGGCNVGYRVVSDSKVKILRMDEPGPWDEYPYPDYPAVLPPEPIRLQFEHSDGDDPDTSIRTAAVFGFDHLSDRQFERVKDKVVSLGFFDPEFVESETPEEYLRTELGFPFVQGRPMEDCPNKRCGNHGVAESLTTFAIFFEDDDRVDQLWGESTGNLQIIWQVCDRCKAIQVTNQCT